MAGNPNENISFRVAFWNATSLRVARNELSVFLVEYQIDAILLSETKLTAGTPDPKITNYQLYRRDRQGERGGGVAIYVRNSIQHYEITMPQLQQMEAVSVNIKTQQGPVTLVSCYNPSGRRQIDADVNAVLNSGEAVIAAGDFNAKNPEWGSRTVNATGRNLSELASRRDDIEILASLEPTYYNNSTGLPDILDIAIARNVQHAIDLTAINVLSSDHVPVIMTIGEGRIEREQISWSKTNWNKFTDSLASDIGNIPRITNVEELENAVNTLEDKITAAISTATVTFSEPRRPEALPAHILELIREKNRARRRWRRTLSQADKRTANRLTNDVRYALINFRSEKWNNKLESLNTEDLSPFWKMSKALRNQNKPLPPIHSRRHGLVFTDEEKSEAFADTLELQCSLNMEDADLDHIEDVEASNMHDLEQIDDINIEPTSPKEVEDLIKDLKTRKAPGPDNISHQALKNLPSKAVIFIVTIINAMFCLQIFPSRWKTANVIFIPKPGKDPQFPQNHRPISLLSAIGKIAEKTIRTRLAKIIQAKKIIPDEQFGFRPQHSTVDQLLRVTEFFTETFNRNQVAGAIFLDVAKAFDSVWHEGLIYKLFQAQIPTRLVRLLHSFVSDRKFKAKIRNSLSSERPLEAGVPQGSVLSPILYSIFTADIPKVANTQLAIYADDTAILARSMQPGMLTTYLQAAVDSLEEWFTRWMIQVNPDKSTALFVTRRKRDPISNVNMQGTDIPWSNEAKYLGVHFDRRLNFQSHVNHAITKAKFVGAKLYPLRCRKSKLSPKNKILLYKAIIRPAMTYASPVWGNVSDTQLKRFQVIQNKFLRQAFNAPWFIRNSQLHREANLPTIREFLNEIAIKTFAKAENHPNLLVREAVAYDEAAPTRHKRPKGVLLRPV